MAHEDTHGLQLRISALEDENARLQAAHVAQRRILDSLEVINPLIIEATDLDEMLGQVLQQFLDFFACDRAWLLYPCDPDAEAFSVPMERTRPQWPGAKTQGVDVPIDDFARGVFTSALSTSSALRYDPEENPLNPADAVNGPLSIRSQMLMAIRPKSGSPWLLGIHHCAAPAVYSQNDRALFEVLGNRLADGLSSLLSWQNTKKLFESADVSIWNEDLSGVYKALNALRLDGVVDLRRYLQDNQQFVWDLAAMVKVLQVNNATLKLFGAKSADEFLYQIDKTFGEDALEVFIDELCAIWNKQKSFRSEVALKSLDGRDLTAIISFQIPETEDAFRSVPVCITDISERKQTEEALRESEEKFRALADTSPLAIYLSSGVEQKAEYINPTFIKLFGYTIDEVPTVAHWYPMAYPDEIYRKYLVDEWQRRVERAIASSSEIEPMEVVVTCKDGSKKNISWGFSAVGTQNWAIGLDLTGRKRAELEKKELEAHLQQAYKMEAIGTMAGGIAHDFNNLLAIIRGNIGIIQRRQETGKPFAKNLENINQSTRRASDLVKQILAFSRQEKPALAPVNLAIAVEESLGLLRSTIPATVEIMSTLENETILVNADTTQLQQVFINLCANAIHAMEAKGMLTVNLQEVDLTDCEIPTATDPQAGRYAKLTITDTGTGMDKETIARIFEPFFTTKSVGEGTGMGLSVTYGIVNSHSGFITVDSTLGQGTSFNIYLPVLDDSSPEPEVNAEQTLPLGTERILFVDDEKNIASSYSELLECQGYKVTSVTSSAEALTLFRDSPEKFDLVFTDQTMPEMTGTELATELLEIRSDIPIILCSGFSATASEHDVKKIGIREFCMKPMDMSQLALTVRKVLDDDGHLS